MNKLIYIAPRIMGLLFVGFLALFALDVFDEYQGAEVVLPLVIHLIPALVLLIVVLIAWQWDLVGAVVFLMAAGGYVLMVGFNRPWSWYAAISGPALAVAILFFLSWQQGSKSKKTAGAVIDYPGRRQ